MQAHATGVIDMIEEQFEVIVGVGLRHSLSVISCDSDFVLNDILTASLGGRCEVNPDWEDAARAGIDRDKDFGTYKVAGIVAKISDDPDYWDYTTTWEKIA